MGKTRSWITYVKKLFTPNSKPKSEKSRNWGWLVDKKLKFRRRSCYLAMEEPPRSALDEAAEEQRKQAVAVAVATAAAAEAAASAASAAIEVVRLANVPYDAERKISGLATIKIQAAYRGHLARKALCALKGIVKLQALVRGELTRKRVSLLVHRRRVAVPLLDYLSHGQNRRSFVPNEGIKFEDKERRNDQNPQERMMTREVLVKPMSRLNTISVDTARLAKVKLETTRKHKNVDDSKSHFSQPRRSFCHAKQKSTGDNVASLPNSPAYMAATECTKAKSRSLSTPRQRLRLCDMYSGPDSPYKLSLSSGGSFNGKIEDRTHKRNSVFEHIYLF